MKIMVLDLIQIREISKSIPGCNEIAFSESRNVISFLTGVSTSPSSAKNSSKLARVNIYYQTGTIGVNHVLNQEVRENFVRKGNLDTVKRVLRNPDDVNREIMFTHLMKLEKKEGEQGVEKITEYGETENSLKKKLELVDVGIAVLVAERDKLIEHVKKNNDNGGRQNRGWPMSHRHQHHDEDDDYEEEDDDFVQEGKNFAYSLPDDSVSKVDEYLDCWEDVKCVATNGQGTVCLYESGDYQFTEGIPRFLSNKLSDRSKSFPAPTYVSIGCEGQYFISFEDGNFEWMGCDAMRDILMKSKREIRTIAFGSSYETFFIVFDNGSWQFDGLIPPGLENKLSERCDRGDLTCVSLGPIGEWFLAAKNGNRWWGGVSEELNNAITPIRDRISFIDFGIDGSFMVRYRLRRY